MNKCSLCRLDQFSQTRLHFSWYYGRHGVSESFDRIKLVEKLRCWLDMQISSTESCNYSELGAIIYRLSGRDQLGDERMNLRSSTLISQTSYSSVGRHAWTKVLFLQLIVKSLLWVRYLLRPIALCHSVLIVLAPLLWISPRAPHQLHCNCLKQTKPPPLPSYQFSLSHHWRGCSKV